jgi:hypothetical protein
MYEQPTMFLHRRQMLCYSQPSRHSRPQFAANDVVFLHDWTFPLMRGNIITAILSLPRLELYNTSSIAVPAAAFIRGRTSYHSKRDSE